MRDYVEIEVMIKFPGICSHWNLAICITYLFLYSSKEIQELQELQEKKKEEGKCAQNNTSS